jgi:hypothetical protein
MSTPQKQVAPMVVPSIKEQHRIAKELRPLSIMDEILNNQPKTPPNSPVMQPQTPLYLEAKRQGQLARHQFIMSNVEGIRNLQEHSRQMQELFNGQK